jgi:hypothetical protein
MSVSNKLPLNSFCPNSYPYMGTMHSLDIEVDLSGKGKSFYSHGVRKKRKKSPTWSSNSDEDLCHLRGKHS